jgi:hypothetical protein
MSCALEAPFHAAAGSRLNTAATQSAEPQAWLKILR